MNGGSEPIHIGGVKQAPVWWLALLAALFLAACGSSSSSSSSSSGGTTTTTTVTPVQWQTAAAIETDNLGDATNPHLAFSAAGNAVAVWQQSDGVITNIWANVYTKGTGWGTAAKIETDDTGAAINPRVAVDSAGNAIAVWQHADGGGVTHIVANRYVYGTGWGTAAAIEIDAVNGAAKPDICFDGSQNAIVVWEQTDGTRTNIWATGYFFAWGSWLVPQLIETDNVGAAINARIACDGLGAAVAVWQHHDGTQYNIKANIKAAAAGWGTEATIDSLGGDAINPQVAYDASGLAVVVWEQAASIFSNRYDGNTWAGDGQIENTTGTAQNPKIAMDGTGQAIATWWYTDGTNYNIYVNRFTAGAWTGAASLATSTQGVNWAPAVAYSANGTAMVVWHQPDGTRNNIWARRFSATWGTAGLIETDNTGSADNPVVAMDSAGNAQALWAHNDATRFNLTANGYR